MATDGGSNIDPKTAEELAKATQNVKNAADGATRAFQEQLRIITQMRDIMNQMAGNMGALGGNLGEAGMSSQTLQEVTKELEKTGFAASETSSASAKLAEVMKSKVVKGFAIGASAITGLFQGFKNVMAISRSVLGFFGSVAGAAFSLGKSIIAIPFKMMQGLFKMASSMGGSNELAAAIEEVRDQFGSLKSDSAKTVIDVAHNMDSMNQTGVSAYRIFGNMAERIKAVNELAKGMGSTFQVFQDEIHKNGTAIMMYQRGLGLTDEQMQAVGYAAMRMGKDISEVQNDMTKQAFGMAKAFGVNAKVLSKDMGKALQDVSHFGSLSTKELAVASTYAQKLGVSVDKLTASMDATKTFEGATDAVSRLNEAFGSNIDATQLMMEENPAKQQEMLRDALRATGKDMSHLDRFQREMIKSTGLMGDEMIDAAFSSKNAGVSLDAIAKQGDKNENKVLSQADAMHELADSIKRLTPSGDAGKGGILDHFLDGVKRGLMSSPEFIKLMHNINVIFREATMYGRKLGGMLVDLFPGIKDIFGGLNKLFDPQRFRNLFNGVLRAFDVFKAGGTGKIEDFIEKLKETFSNFFDTGKEGGKQVLNLSLIHI